MQEFLLKQNVFLFYSNLKTIQWDLLVYSIIKMFFWGRTFLVPHTRFWFYVISATTYVTITPSAISVS